MNLCNGKGLVVLDSASSNPKCVLECNVCRPFSFNLSLTNIHMVKSTPGIESGIMIFRRLREVVKSIVMNLLVISLTHRLGLSCVLLTIRKMLFNDGRLFTSMVYLSSNGISVHSCQCHYYSQRLDMHLRQ